MWWVANLSSSNIFGQKCSPKSQCSQSSWHTERSRCRGHGGTNFSWTCGHWQCPRTSPALILLFLIVARSALQFIHTDHTPASTVFRPVSFAMQDYTVRFPSTSLVLGKRALGNPVNPKPGYELGTIMYIMLILSEDIELNSGPATSIYPCGLCDRKVGWDDRVVACDSCDIWYHCSCISMQSSEYSRLNSTTENWKCYRCDFTFPDHSLYHSHNVDVSNSFSLLAGPMFNDSP